MMHHQNKSLPHLSPLCSTGTTRSLLVHSLQGRFHVTWVLSHQSQGVNWSRLSLKFTLSCCCVALWWIIAPVWLTTVMGDMSVEPLQLRGRWSTIHTAPTLICSNLRWCLVEAKYLLGEITEILLFCWQESSQIYERTVWKLVNIWWGYERIYARF